MPPWAAARLTRAFRPSPVNRRRILLAGGWFYASLGVAFNALGPALEAIREEFVLEYVGAGMALAAVGLGYTVGSLVGGPISDRVGTRPSIIVASALAALGMLLAGVSPAYLAFLAGLAVASIGWGATEVAVTSLIARAGAALSVPGPQSGAAWLRRWGDRRAGHRRWVVRP